jgi:hypothetical protein
LLAKKLCPATVEVNTSRHEDEDGRLGVFPPPYLSEAEMEALEEAPRRRALFGARDDIDRRREQLIADIKGKLGQKTILQELFSIRWKII